jgi:hypothetical protein
MRTARFTFLCNAEERRLLAAVAARLSRTESDVLRWLVRETARELNVASGSDQANKAGDTCEQQRTVRR